MICAESRGGDGDGDGEAEAGGGGGGDGDEDESSRSGSGTAESLKCGVWRGAGAGAVGFGPEGRSDGADVCQEVPLSQCWNSAQRQWPLRGLRRAETAAQPTGRCVGSTIALELSPAHHTPGTRPVDWTRGTVDSSHHYHHHGRPIPPLQSLVSPRAGPDAHRQRLAQHLRQGPPPTATARPDRRRPLRLSKHTTQLLLNPSRPRPERHRPWRNLLPSAPPLLPPKTKKKKKKTDTTPSQ